jgi:hypothetical protein
MRQFNIAPEMYVGVQIKNNPSFCDFDGKITKIEEDKHIVCGNGVVFERGYSVTVNFLETVYSERQRYKALMKNDYKKLDILKKELNSLEEELEALNNI